MNNRREQRKYMRNLRVLIILNFLAAVFYLGWILDPMKIDFLPLYVAFIAAEAFNIWQASGYWMTVWGQKWPNLPERAEEDLKKTVDIYITVCNEPEEIVERTLVAALAIDHPAKTVYLLDDSEAPGVSGLAAKHGCGYITRSDRAGAKAGNINNAMTVTSGDYILILDADHVPLPEFLARTMTGFRDERMAYVQTPQWYENIDSSQVASSSNDQQQLFYGPILRGKNGLGAVFSCGTNVIFRRTALEEVGGVATDSITEDLSTSINLQQLGWKSVYVPEVLASGLGPEDLGAYSSQQMRWARGGLAVLLNKGVFGRNLTFAQRYQYLLSFAYWLTGPVYVLYLLALTYGLYTGERPFRAVLEYPAHFLPYFLLTLATIAYSARGSFTFRAVWLTLCSFSIHIGAFYSTITGKKLGFVVTPKTANSNSYLRLAVPHMVLMALLAGGMIHVFFWANTPSGISNSAFAAGHIIVLGSYIRLSQRAEIAPAPSPAYGKQPREVIALESAEG